jgi:CRP-like cAMP-binding protein
MVFFFYFCVVKHGYIAQMQTKDELFNLSGSIHDVWRLLNERERLMVRQNASILHFKKNQQIYREGEEPKEMMCLLKGKVKIYKDGIGRRSQIIRMIKPVQYFAYRAYFANENYLTAAAAFEPSTVCLIPMKVVMDIMELNYDVCKFFIRQLSTDLGIADERTVNLTQKHIRGRLAESLVFLIDSYGLEDDATINIYLAREDLANLSNMTTSNAIRTLSTFVSEKVIALDGRKIKVIDEEKLRKISKLG